MAGFGHQWSEVESGGRNILIQLRWNIVPRVPRVWIIIKQQLFLWARGVDLAAEASIDFGAHLGFKLQGSAIGSLNTFAHQLKQSRKAKPLEKEWTLYQNYYREAVI